MQARVGYGEHSTPQCNAACSSRVFSYVKNTLLLNRLHANTEKENSLVEQTQELYTESWTMLTTFKSAASIIEIHAEERALLSGSKVYPHLPVPTQTGVYVLLNNHIVILLLNHDQTFIMKLLEAIEGNVAESSCFMWVCFIIVKYVNKNRVKAAAWTEEQLEAGQTEQSQTKVSPSSHKPWRRKLPKKHQAACSATGTFGRVTD